jgi:hypothetical protein
MRQGRGIQWVLFLLFALLAVFGGGCGGGGGHSSGSAIVDDKDGEKVLQAAIVNNMGEDTTVINDQYSKYFKEDTAVDGVKAIIAAGKFIMNGYAIPATEAECAAKYPDGYTVNETAWLYKSGDGWIGGKPGGGPPKIPGSYDAAALATATGLPAGLEVRLYDTNKDGYTDLIETHYLEALIASKITDNGDGTYSVDRGELDSSITYSTNDGNPFDGSHFTSTSREVIKKANFDTTIKEGNIALFWYGPDGWVMQRALEINGIFVDGSDHNYYQMDEVKYQDAMQFSRDNVIISNRPGEFANAHNYFGFNNNSEGLKVSLWLVPTTNYPETTGAPIGFTSNEYEGIFLAKAIAAAKVKLGSVVVSTDGTDVALGIKWTTPAVYDELREAITRAETAQASGASLGSLDYQGYLLYLTLNGSLLDIGARFAGYYYVGFDKQIKTGPD